MTTDREPRRASTSLVYRHAAIYRIAMRFLDGRERAERHRRIVDAIPRGAEVVELCCGPADLASALQQQGCRYVGLDINRGFVRNAQRRGIDARYWDAETMEIPGADVVCMFSSLYQFIPRERELFDRMTAKARRLVMISEPVRNWATGQSPILRTAARALTRVNGKTFQQRHSEQSLRALVDGLPAESVDFNRSGREVFVIIRTARR